MQISLGKIFHADLTEDENGLVTEMRLFGVGPEPAVVVFNRPITEAEARNKALEEIQRIAHG